MIVNISGANAVDSTPIYIPESAKWHALIGQAEHDTDSLLPQDVENYLVNMLMSFSDWKNDVDEQGYEEVAGIFSERQLLRYYNMKQLGDRCLVLTGFYPHHPSELLLPIGHFVELGRDAYREISSLTNDRELFLFLSDQFVLLMDILQQIRELSDGHQYMDLLQTYEIWQETGSQRALSILNEQTHSIPAYEFSEQLH